MSIESIAGAVTAQKQELVQKEVSVRVLKMALDAQAAQGAQLAQMMDQSAGLGTRINTQG
ncbi:MAG: putative motility protein [Holophaga sp.]|nr:putative motility protein [Holophaga sp.]